MIYGVNVSVSKLNEHCITATSYYSSNIMFLTSEKQYHLVVIFLFQK